MDLIDREKLPREVSYCAETEHDIGYEEGAQSIIEEINDAPTIDAIPIVKAKWVDMGLKRKFVTYDNHIHYDGMNCSNCGGYGESRFNFCPHCGSVMENVTK